MQSGQETQQNVPAGRVIKVLAARLFNNQTRSPKGLRVNSP